MKIESIDYEYKNGVLVQLENDDAENLAYSVEWMKQEIIKCNIPEGNFFVALRLLERIIKAVK